MARQWTAADVSKELYASVAELWNANSDLSAMIAAIANALHVPPPGEDGECVVARFPACVDVDGEWRVIGDSRWRDAEAAESVQGQVDWPNRLSWITVRLPKPMEPVEVAARVEL